MSEESPARPTPEQERCALALVTLMGAGIPYADALAVIRVIARDGNTERSRAIGTLVTFGIPADEAERYADDPGMCAALLALIHAMRGAAPPC